MIGSKETNAALPQPDLGQRNGVEFSSKRKTKRGEDAARAGKEREELRLLRPELLSAYIQFCERRESDFFSTLKTEDSTLGTDESAKTLTPPPEVLAEKQTTSSAAGQPAKSDEDAWGACSGVAETSATRGLRRDPLKKKASGMSSRLKLSGSLQHPSGSSAPLSTTASTEASPARSEGEASGASSLHSATRATGEEAETADRDAEGRKEGEDLSEEQHATLGKHSGKEASEKVSWEKNLQGPESFEAELRFRLEQEMCRRLPLLPLAFTETYTLYKSNTGLGPFFQRGSPLAAGTRARIQEAAEQVLLKCLELTKSQQQSLVLEQRPEYEALRREWLAREQVAHSVVQKVGGGEEEDRGPTDREIDAERLEERDGGNTTEKGKLGKRGEDGPEGRAQVEAERGEEEFVLTDEDREIMELLGHDVSLLDSSINLPERAKQMADQLCEVAFYGQPDGDRASGSFFRAGLFNLNLGDGSGQQPRAVGDKPGSSSDATPQSSLAPRPSVSSSMACNDRNVLEEAAQYLHAVAIPLLGSLLGGQHLCSVPLESSSIKSLFHALGVNLRYLGEVTKYIENHQQSAVSDGCGRGKLALPIRVLHLEMTIRSAAWCFNALLSRLRFGQVGAATAHLLSCLLCPPDVSYPSQRFPLPSGLSMSGEFHEDPSTPEAFERQAAARLLASLTPEKLWCFIRQRVTSHFKYAMPADRARWACVQSPAGRYVLLRGICRAVGIQLAAGGPLLRLLGTKSLWEPWGGGSVGEVTAQSSRPSGEWTDASVQASFSVRGKGKSGLLSNGVVGSETGSSSSLVPRGDFAESEDAKDGHGENCIHATHTGSVRGCARLGELNGDVRPERGADAPQPLHAENDRSLFCPLTAGRTGASWRFGYGCTKAAWSPLRPDGVVELFPVLKSHLIVSHLTRHMLAVATQCYILGWLDAALELYQQVLFVIHQLSGAVCR